MEDFELYEVIAIVRSVAHTHYQLLFHAEMLNFIERPCFLIPVRNFFFRRVLFFVCDLKDVT